MDRIRTFFDRLRKTSVKAVLDRNPPAEKKTVEEIISNRNHEKYDDTCLYQGYQLSLRGEVSGNFITAAYGSIEVAYKMARAEADSMKSGWFNPNEFTEDDFKTCVGLRWVTIDSTMKSGCGVSYQFDDYKGVFGYHSFMVYGTIDERGVITLDKEVDFAG